MAQDIQAGLARIEARYEERLARIEAELRELRDREAIRELRCRYHECVNQGKWSDIPELFTEDGEMDFGYLGQGRGRAEIARVFDAGSRLLPFVKQFIHNHVIQLEGDGGTGVSYLEAKSVSRDQAYVVAGRYDDWYVRENGEWRFARMDFTPYFAIPFDESWAQDDLLKMGRRPE